METDAASQPVYLFIKKGTSTNDVLNIQAGGSSAVNRIFITTDDADTGQKPVINRSTNGNGVVKGNGVTVSHITIDGLAIQSASGARPMYFADYDCLNSPSDDIVVRNCDVTAEGFGMTFNGCGGNHGSHYIIENNTIHYTGDPSVVPGDGIMVLSNDDVSIRNNIVTNFPHTNVTIHRGLYMYVYENDISGPDLSYGRGLGILADHVYIFRNYIHNQRTRDQLGGNPIYVYNNVYANMKNCCSVPLEGDCPDAQIHNQENCPQLSGTGQAINFRIVPAGYATQADKNVYAMNNIFYRTAETSIYVTGNSDNNFQSITIRNNIFEDGANACELSDVPQGSEYTNIDYAIALWDWSGGLDPFNNIEISKNIFWPVTKARTQDAIKQITGTNSPQTIPIDGSLTGINSCPWSSGTGNIRVNPAMSDPSNEVYRPNDSSSFIIGQGVAIPPIPGAPPGGDIGDAIHPATDFNDFVNTVSSTHQDDHGSGWEIGAIVYIFAEDIVPPESPRNLRISTP